MSYLSPLSLEARADSTLYSAGLPRTLSSRGPGWLSVPGEAVHAHDTLAVLGRRRQMFVPRRLFQFL